jgi:hypothetical protein
MGIELSITGLQEAQQANLRLIAAMKPGGRLAGAVQYGAIEAHRYATAITHVWIYRGGALKASHRIKWNGGLEATVSIDESAVNPRGQRPAIYGPYEHRRGGEHAFYQRTVDERGATISKNMRDYFLKGLP